jgi:hypothetical protein
MFASDTHSYDRVRDSQLWGSRARFGSDSDRFRSFKIVQSHLATEMSLRLVNRIAWTALVQAQLADFRQLHQERRYRLAVERNRHQPRRQRPHPPHRHQFIGPVASAASRHSQIRVAVFPLDKRGPIEYTYEHSLQSLFDNLKPCSSHACAKRREVQR